MKKIEIEIPDGKRTEWVDGVLTLVDDKPAEFKFKVGDKVQVFGFLDPQEITGRISIDCKPFYKLEPSGVISEEFELDPYTEPKDITERIKTFADAYEWCEKNNKQELVYQYESISETIEEDDYDVVPSDIIAYLKLRIITCALNEGWEPTFEINELRWYNYYHTEDCELKLDSETITYDLQKSRMLVLKTPKLAEYAATQFKDIYMDFCYKGKE